MSDKRGGLFRPDGRYHVGAGLAPESPQKRRLWVEPPRCLNTMEFIDQARTTSDPCWAGVSRTMLDEDCCLRHCQGIATGCAFAALIADASQRFLTVFACCISVFISFDRLGLRPPVAP